MSYCSSVKEWRLRRTEPPRGILAGYLAKDLFSKTNKIDYTEDN